MNEEKYYQLNELPNIVDLKIRSLKYRMIKIKEKYKDRKDLLFRKGRCWQIHNSILFEFDRNKKTKLDNDFHMKSFVTISPDGNYDVESLVVVVNEIYKQLSYLRPDLSIRYYVEEGKNEGSFHLHFIINLSLDFKMVIKRSSKYYIESNIDIRPVHLERNLITYLEKEVRSKGTLK